MNLNNVIDDVLRGVEPLSDIPWSKVSEKVSKWKLIHIEKRGLSNNFDNLNVILASIEVEIANTFDG